MRIITLYSLAILFLNTSKAQVQAPIEIRKAFGGIKLLQNGELLKPKAALSIMQYNQDAYKEFKKAKSNYDGAQVIGFVGGFLVGWPLGTALGGGESQWGLAAAGAGLILISIPLNSSYTKHATKAVEIFNSDLKASVRVPAIFSVSPYLGGVSLKIRF